MAPVRSKILLGSTAKWRVGLPVTFFQKVRAARISCPWLPLDIPWNAATSLDTFFNFGVTLGVFGEMPGAYSHSSMAVLLLGSLGAQPAQCCPVSLLLARLAPVSLCQYQALTWNWRHLGMSAPFAVHTPGVWSRSLLHSGVLAMDLPSLVPGMMVLKDKSSSCSPSVSQRICVLLSITDANI